MYFTLTAMKPFEELRTREQILEQKMLSLLIQKIPRVLGAMSQELCTKTKICIYYNSQYHT